MKKLHWQVLIVSYLLIENNLKTNMFGFILKMFLPNNQEFT